MYARPSSRKTAVQIAVFADFGEHLFHQRLPSLLLSRARGIELVEQIELFELFVEY